MAATKLTTGFEKFAKQQRELNPDITDEQIQALWSQQPLNKRIASGIESAVLTPTRAIAAIPEAVGAGYKKLDEFSRSGPNLKVDTRDMPPLWGPERTAYKQEQERIKSISPDTGQPELKLPEMKPLIAAVPTEAELQNTSTPELKKSIKESLKQLDKQEEGKKAVAGDTPKGEAATGAAEKKDSYASARDRAYDLYEKAKTRNDWLELAQLLGQAFSQYGAAQAGMKTGRMMAGLQIPSVDYGARSERAGRELETRLRDISGQEESKQRAEDRAAEREATAQYRKEVLQQKREEAAAKAAADPYAKMEAGASLKQQEELQKSLSEQLKAAQMVYSAQSALAKGGLTDKQEAAAEAQIQKFAGPAGIDLVALEAASKEPGMIYGTNVSETKKATNLGLAIAEMQRRLDALREQPRQVRVPGRQGAQQSDTMAPATSGPKVGEVVDGYKFKGGNPADKNNWELVTGK